MSTDGEGSSIGALDAVTIDCADPLALAGFWARIFGTRVEPAEGDPPHYVDLLPAPGLPILRFQRVPEPKTVKNRLHLDVSVTDLDVARERVEALGGRRASETPFSEYGYRWLVMTDPEGNEFCLVVPPGTT
jgi:predicted enzyme related to lactoylglutathione lyase